MTQSSSVASCDEPVASSSSGWHPKSDHVDMSIVYAARRREFVPPNGLRIDECWQRMNEMVLRGKLDSDGIRLGDFLIISNALISNGRLDCVSSRDLIELVHFRLKHRSRFPNILTMIHFLRLLNHTRGSILSLRAITLSLQVAPRLRVSELVEILALIVKTGALQQFSSDDVVDLLSTIHSRLRQCDKSDPAIVETDRKNIVRLLEYVYSSDFDITNLDDLKQTNLISLTLSLMDGRSCSYPNILSGMIDTGLHESLSMRNRSLIADGILKYQLRGWRYVESLFESEEWNVKLNQLGTDTGVDFSFSSHQSEPKETLVFGDASSFKGFTGKYERIYPDLNGGPIYRKIDGHFYLFFSPSSSCWQVSTDTGRDSLRVAFIPGEPGDPPMDQEGWRVFSRKYSSFVPTNLKTTSGEFPSPQQRLSSPTPRRSMSSGLVEEDSLFPEPTSITSGEDILTSWDNVCLVPQRTEKLDDLNTKLASIEDKIRSLESLFVGVGKITPIREEPKPVRSLLTVVSERMNSWFAREVVTVVPDNSSFDEIRTRALREEKLEGTAKKISRQFERRH